MKNLLRNILESFKKRQQDKKAHKNWIKTYRMIDEWRKEQDEQGRN